MAKILLVTQLPTSNQEDVTSFSMLVRSVFPEFTKNCKQNSVNCLRFFHRNTSESELRKYIEEKPVAIIFHESCSAEIAGDLAEKIMVMKKDAYSPQFITTGENCNLHGMRKVRDMWEAKSMIEEDLVLVV